MPDSEQLTEATYRTLERLVFIRFLEDKGIEAPRLPTPRRNYHMKLAWICAATLAAGLITGCGKQEQSASDMGATPKPKRVLSASGATTARPFGSGEVVALIGENGAGKSTLMKILGGVHQADEGTIHLEGRPAEIRKVADAIALGIGFIHQELNVLDNLDVAANIFLGVACVVAKAPFSASSSARRSCRCCRTLSTYSASRVR